MHQGHYISSGLVMICQMSTPHMHYMHYTPDKILVMVPVLVLVLVGVLVLVLVVTLVPWRVI